MHILNAQASPNGADAGNAKEGASGANERRRRNIETPGRPAARQPGAKLPAQCPVPANRNSQQWQNPAINPASCGRNKPEMHPELAPKLDAPGPGPRRPTPGPAIMPDERQ